MKILLLNDQYSITKGGGAAANVQMLFNRLSAAGHDVFVITTTQDKNLAGINQNIFTIYTPYYHERWRAYVGLYNKIAIQQVKKIMASINPDIVHAHNIHYYLSYHCLKIAKQPGRKIFITLHDVMPFHYGKMTEMGNSNQIDIPKYFNYKINGWQIIRRFKKRYNPLRNILIKKYLQYADKIFTVSDALKDACGQNGINNITVIHNGIDVNKWQITDDEVKQFQLKYNLNGKKIILLAGRINDLKGGKVILTTLEKIKKSINNAVLLILANEDDHKAKTNSNPGIIHTGWLNGNELKSAYHASDVITVPSICFDSFPTVNLEAFACQKPVVATCFGGSKEIVKDGISGYIVNPYNTDAMAEKIIDLLKNPDKARAFGKAGYEKVIKEFSLQQNYENIFKFYSKN